MLMAVNSSISAIKNQDEKRLFDYKNYKFHSTTAFLFCFLLLRRLFRLARQSQIRIRVKVLHTNSTTWTLFHFGFTASTTLFFLINFYRINMNSFRHLLFANYVKTSLTLCPLLALVGMCSAPTLLANASAIS